MSPIRACCVQLHVERKITKGEGFWKYEVKDFSTNEIAHKPFFECNIKTYMIINANNLA